MIDIAKGDGRAAICLQWDGTMENAEIIEPQLAEVGVTAVCSEVVYVYERNAQGVATRAAPVPILSVLINGLLHNVPPNGWVVIEDGHVFVLPMEQVGSGTNSPWTIKGGSGAAATQTPA